LNETKLKFSCSNVGSTAQCHFNYTDVHTNSGGRNFRLIVVSSRPCDLVKAPACPKDHVNKLGNERAP